MAQRKQAEAEFAKLMNGYNVWTKKWQDVRYCPNCRKPIFMVKRAQGEEEQATIVDYLLVISGRVHWVEVKGKGDQHRLSFSDISERQVEFMNSWSDAKVPCWIFISLGDGTRAPKGRKVWLIPWSVWLDTWDLCHYAGMKSIPWLPTNRKADLYNMTEEFPLYELTWEGGEWTIPETHPLYPDVAYLEPLY